MNQRSIWVCLTVTSLPLSMETSQKALGVTRQRGIVQLLAMRQLLTSCLSVSFEMETHIGD